MRVSSSSLPALSFMKTRGRSGRGEYAKGALRVGGTRLCDGHSTLSLMIPIGGLGRGKGLIPTGALRL
jgi:hypothetical protein